MKINLHIEKLILRELDIQSNQIKTIKVAIQEALVQKLKMGGVGQDTQTLGRHKSVPGGTIGFSDGEKSASVGTKIGNAVFDGINR